MQCRVRRDPKRTCDRDMGPSWGWEEYLGVRHMLKNSSDGERTFSFFSFFFFSL